MQCDCEHEKHEEMGLYAHRAGCCKQAPKVRAVTFGMIQNLCGPCFEFGQNMAVIGEEPQQIAPRKV
jgi:hypothetical protein